MQSYKRPISFIFLVLFFGAIIGTIFSQLLGSVLPDGVVKDFFLLTRTIGWGLKSDNWIDLYIIRLKSGFLVDISVVSILGMSISWYFLRYFK
tara:strand:- start:510 stop:788 length:279 start_codon:yes stop_codon:yes gene_type:complete